MKLFRRITGESRAEVSLLQACRNENVAELREILRNTRVPIPVRDDRGATPLHCCSTNSTTTCAELLLGHDLDLINVKDSQGHTAILYAIRDGSKNFLEFLIQHGADLNVSDNEGRTAVHWATVLGRINLIDILSDNGANLSAKDNQGATALHYSSQKCNHDQENMNHQESGTRCQYNVLLLKKLLQKKAKVNAQDLDGRTPIIWAACSGCPEACRMLLDAGSSHTDKDCNGLTALHCAAARGHVHCLKLLLARGATTDATDNNGCTPLFYATVAESNRVATVRCLLDAQSNSNAADMQGRSSAHWAASRGHVDCLKELIGRGCDVWAENNTGDLPIHEAAMAGQTETVKFLLELKRSPLRHSSTIRKPRKSPDEDGSMLTDNLPLARKCSESSLKFALKNKKNLISNPQNKQISDNNVQIQMDLEKYKDLEIQSQSENGIDSNKRVDQSSVIDNGKEKGKISINNSADKKNVNAEDGSKNISKPVSIETGNKPKKYQTNNKDSLKFQKNMGKKFPQLKPSDLKKAVKGTVEEKVTAENQTLNDSAENEEKVFARQSTIEDLENLEKDIDKDILELENTQTGKTCLHIAAGTGNVELVRYLLEEQNASKKTTFRVPGRDGVTAYDCAVLSHSLECAELLRPSSSDSEGQYRSLRNLDLDSSLDLLGTDHNDVDKDSLGNKGNKDNSNNIENIDRDKQENKDNADNKNKEKTDSTSKEDKKVQNGALLKSEADRGRYLEVSTQTDRDLLKLIIGEVEMCTQTSNQGSEPDELRSSSVSLPSAISSSAGSISARSLGAGSSPRSSVVLVGSSINERLRSPVEMISEEIQTDLSFDPSLNLEDQLKMKEEKNNEDQDKNKDQNVEPFNISKDNEDKINEKITKKKADLINLNERFKWRSSKSWTTDNVFADMDLTNDSHWNEVKHQRWAESLESMRYIWHSVDGGDKENGAYSGERSSVENSKRVKIREEDNQNIETFKQSLSGEIDGVNDNKQSDIVTIVKVINKNNEKLENEIQKKGTINSKDIRTQGAGTASEMPLKLDDTVEIHKKGASNLDEGYWKDLMAEGKMIHSSVSDLDTKLTDKGVELEEVQNNNSLFYKRLNTTENANINGELEKPKVCVIDSRNLKENQHRLKNTKYQNNLLEVPSGTRQDLDFESHKAIMKPDFDISQMQTNFDFENTLIKSNSLSGSPLYRKHFKFDSPEIRLNSEYSQIDSTSGKRRKVSRARSVTGDPEELNERKRFIWGHLSRHHTDSEALRHYSRALLPLEGAWRRAASSPGQARRPLLEDLGTKSLKSRKILKNLKTTTFCEDNYSVKQKIEEDTKLSKKQSKKLQKDAQDGILSPHDLEMERIYGRFGGKPIAVLAPIRNLSKIQNLNLNSTKRIDSQGYDNGVQRFDYGLTSDARFLEKWPRTWTHGESLGLQLWNRLLGSTELNAEREETGVKVWSRNLIQEYVSIYHARKMIGSFIKRTVQEELRSSSCKSNPGFVTSYAGSKLWEDPRCSSTGLQKLIRDYREQAGHDIRLILTDAQVKQIEGHVQFRQKLKDTLETLDRHETLLKRLEKWLRIQGMHSLEFDQPPEFLIGSFTQLSGASILNHPISLMNRSLDTCDSIAGTISRKIRTSKIPIKSRRMVELNMKEVSPNFTYKDPTKEYKKIENNTKTGLENRKISRNTKLLPEIAVKNYEAGQHTTAKLMIGSESITQNLNQPMRGQMKTNALWSLADISHALHNKQSNFLPNITD